MSAPEVAQATLEGALDLLAALDLGIEVVLRGLGEVAEGSVDDEVTRLGCGGRRRATLRALALGEVGLSRFAVLVDVLAHALPAVDADEPVEDDADFVVEAFFAGDFLAVDFCAVVDAFFAVALVAVDAFFAGAFFAAEDVLAVDFFAVAFVAVDAFFAGAFFADDDADADFLSAERAGRREGAGATPGATSATVAPAVSATVATPVAALEAAVLDRPASDPASSST